MEGICFGITVAHALPHSLMEITTMKTKEETQSKSQDSGSSWQFYLVMSVIALSVLGIVLKAIGLF
jgi:hypothetical protein